MNPLKADRDLAWQVLDSLTVEIAVVNKNGEIRAVNEAWRRFCLENGGSLDKCGVGSNYLDVCRTTTGEDASFAQRACRGIEDVLSGSRDEYKLEYPCHSPTQRRWFLLYVSPLKDSVEDVVTAHLSITDRKLLESQLVEAERLAAIGQAMQGLSHEGRNALQRSQGCLDLLRLQVGQDSDALQLIERVENSQRQLLSLYEEVRSYAAPITLNRSLFRLDDIVDEVWAIFQPYWLHVKFSHQHGAEPLNCVIDPAAISEVLKLVFDNALATRVQSPEIKVSYADTELNGKPAVTMIVDDNGPGFRAHDKERVFEPFFTTKQRGTGLGLTICKRIVSAHGGRIGIGTSDRRGASVRITLPTSK